MKKTKIYCLPGMGTDRRLFDALAEALPEMDLCVWEHIEPLSAREPMEQYLERAAAHWEQPEEPPVVLGMSLGGLVAAEWCRRHAYRKLILVSTLHLSSERPFYFGWLRRLPLHSLIPGWLTRVSWGRWGKFLGITDAAGQELLREMIGAASLMHLRWGRHTAVTWTNEQALEHCLRIHGDRDHVFPYRRIKQVDYTIKNGTHCAIFNNADQIAEILRRELTETP